MKALGPNYRISFAGDDGRQSERISGRHFRLDHRCLSEFFYSKLPPLLDDLLRISTSVYVIDRLMKRCRKENGRTWPRRVRVSVEVLEPEFWSSKQVCMALTNCLEFVSGDCCWEFQFEKDCCSQVDDENAFLEYTNPFGSDEPLVCLYSGGLDSAAGLVRRIAACPGRPIIPVTVWHQSMQRKLVRHQFQAIKHKYRADLSPVIVKTLMVSDSKAQKEERSQRCRSFLFTAVGGVVAAMQGTQTVEVFESGIGAINLPLMAGMVGSKATRSSHPEFLRRMSSLVTLAARRKINYHLPFMDQTKGEMVKALAETGLEKLACATKSCVHYPLRERNKQCGICPACILRQQAMIVAGIREPRGTYKYNPFGPSRLVDRIPEKRLRFLKAFLMQVAHMSVLDTQADLPRRLRRHLFGSGIMRIGESPHPVIELLRQYRDEWLTIAAKGKERGWHWASLISPTTVANQGGLTHASA